jgi:hypothetical protein
MVSRQTGEFTVGGGHDGVPITLPTWPGGVSEIAGDLAVLLFGQENHGRLAEDFSEHQRVVHSDPAVLTQKGVAAEAGTLLTPILNVSRRSSESSWHR